MPLTFEQQEALLARAHARDLRAIGRLCSLIEDRAPESDALLMALDPSGGQALRIGFTGPPGSGKSTLLQRAITHYRADGQPLALVAVDPTSPRTGGALLGDRLRWTSHDADAGLYIRSMASRGHAGGLAAATRDVVAALDGLGFPRILVETVGMGQVGTDIAGAVDLVAVVLVPESGDAVQMLKAGVLELADIYVINKADRPGAQALADSLQGALEIAHAAGSERALPPIILTSATGENLGDSDGVAELFATIGASLAVMQTTGALMERRKAQRVQAVESIVFATLDSRARENMKDSSVVAAALPDLYARRVAPQALARQILSNK